MTTSALPSAFDRRFRDGVRYDTRAAYKLASERIWSPSDGFGPLLFGFAVYLNLDRRFSSRFAPTSQASLKHTPTMRGPELRGYGLRLRWNKTGSAIGQPDAVERPTSTLIEMAQLNMVPQLSMGLDEVPPVNWVLAHTGNAQDGLLAVHLAAPQLSRDGRSVVGWRECVPIFDVRRPDLDFPDLDTAGLPESVDLGELQIEYLAGVPASLAEDESVGTDGE
jgi:hypothetical protein